MTSVMVCSFINSKIYVFVWDHAKNSKDSMSRILFNIYFQLNAEVFQVNTAVLSVLHSLKRLITSGRNFHRTKIIMIMLICCLKQFKYFILKFSISGNFFSEKGFLSLYTMILFSFCLGGCVDEIANNQTNNQDYFTFISFSITHLKSSVLHSSNIHVRLSEKLFLMHTFA